MTGHSSDRLTRRQLLHRSGGALGGLAGLGLLTACGGGSASTLAPSATSVAVATAPATPPPSDAPTATVAASQATASVVTGSAAPSAAPSVAPSATASGAAAASPTRGQVSSPVATAARSAPAFNGVAAGRTPEGFFTLGDPAAAATLIDYSDFL